MNECVFIYRTYHILSQGGLQFYLVRSNVSLLKLAIIVFLLLGHEDSAEILASVWQEEKNFEVLKRCYIQYISNQLLAVLCKSC